MKTYEVTLTQTFLVKTDNLQRSMEEYEFSIFPNDEAEFVDGSSTWDETDEEVNA
jgi:hypothetical protein